MALSVRPARPDEWQTWRALRLRALADAPDAFGETLEAARAKDEAAWVGGTATRPDALRLLAERDGLPIGMMVVAISDDSRRANIYAMWVAPEARRSGAGSTLVAAGLAWARSRAALDVSLRVSERCPGALALYLRCGLADTGERSPVRAGSDIASLTLAIRLAPLFMGVVNITPDSFSDGGAYLDPGAALAHGLQLLRDGADILDIGGEATNPKAAPTPVAEELRRVLPVVDRLAAMGATISIDTTKAEVARAAVAAGATIVNDVSGGLFDPEMVQAIAELDVTYIACHLRGRSLAEVFAAEGTVRWQTVADELAVRIATLPPAKTWVDPGIGFGKGADPEGNVALLRHAGDIAATLRRPIVVGPSRKRFLRRLLGLQDLNIDALDAASALASIAALRAGAHVVRAHNVGLLHTAWTAYNKK